MHYVAGDKPGPLVFDLPDDVPGTAQLKAGGFSFGGATIPSADIEAGTLSFTPTVPLVAGVHRVRPTVVVSSTILRTLDLEPVVVEALDGWHGIESARREWDGAPLNDLTLYRVLTLAREGVTEYAPDISTMPGFVEVPGHPGLFQNELTADAVPEAWVQAQLMQARNTWNAARVDPANGNLGSDSFVIRPVPLDWAIKQILRPKAAVPRGIW